MSYTLTILLFFLTLALLGVFLYWLLVVTEGAYLGRRMVVWMYDATAHKYDGIKEFEPDAERLFVIWPLLRELEPDFGPRILDVATGTGRLPLFLLSEPTFNGRITGLDASAKMLQQAHAKLSPFKDRAALVQQTAVPLPFPDNAFDAVTCLEALEFFPSDSDALREMVRVLRPGGVLLVTRRRGWEAKSFLGRYRSRGQFEAFLTGLGLNAVRTQPWQIDYDQVWGKKETLH